LACRLSCDLPVDLRGEVLRDQVVVVGLESFQVWLGVAFGLEEFLDKDEKRTLYVPALVKSLNNPDETIRANAAAFLRRNDPEGAARQLRAKVKLRQALESPDLFKDAIVIAPVVYIAFCLINLQSGPDLLPLFPLLGIFAGWLITEMSQSLRSIGAVTNRPALLRAVEALPALALALVCALTLFRAVTFRLTDWTLRHQDTQLKVISDLIGPNDKIYVHGAVEILVLLNRPNLNPYIMWDHGKARYIAAKKFGGSTDAMVDAIEAERPKLVAVSRLRQVPERVALERWLEQHYETLPITGYYAYLRKQ